MTYEMIGYAILVAMLATAGSGELIQGAPGGIAMAQQPGPGYQYPLGTQPNQYQTPPMQGGPMDYNNAPPRGSGKSEKQAMDEAFARIRERARVSAYPCLRPS